MTIPRTSVTASQAKILVVRGGAIGDFVLTLPALTALREQFPQVRLEVLGYAHIAQLALAGGIVDAVRSIEAGLLAGFFARNGTLAPELADYFSRCAIIISYLYDPDKIFETNVALCSKAQFIAGPHRPDEKAGLPAAKVFLQPLERLAIFEPDPIPRLQIGGLHFAAGQTTGLEAASTRRLAIHPGSGSERKNWSHQRWTELLHRIVNGTPWRLVLIGGEAEGTRLDSLTSAVPPSRLEIARNLPLTELAACLTKCDAFVGHDSGISHLAAALGVAGLVLWGDSVESVWRPPHAHVQIVRTPEGLGGITVERVFAELNGLLSATNSALQPLFPVRARVAGGRGRSWP